MGLDMKIALLVIAVGLDEDYIKRFEEYAKASESKYDFDIIIEKGQKQEKFYKSRLLNKHLRDLVNRYDFIIQTDIDLIIPPGLIERTVDKYLTNTINHSVLRKLDEDSIEKFNYEKFPWEEWLTRKHILCSGCWNGADSKTWKRSGGFNEEMFDWGGEDTEFMYRSRRRGIKWNVFYIYPLVHIWHPQRTQCRGDENMKLVSKFCKNHDFLFDTCGCRGGEDSLS